MIDAEAPRRGVTDAVLAPLLRADPRRPRLTWYGEGRTELSTASLANWSAKVAGLLVDELGAEPGDRVAVLARPSWQVLPIVLGAWWAGLAVTADDTSGALAAFVDAGQDAAADDVFAVSTHPFGLPHTSLAGPAQDFSTAVRHHADRYAAGPVEPSATAVLPTGGPSLTVASLTALAADGAVEFGPSPRLLMRSGGSVLESAVTLLAALSADGALVVVDTAHGHDPAAIAADERVGVTVAVDVPGLPRARAWEDLIESAFAVS